MNNKSHELYQIDRVSLDKCSIQCLKLVYWKLAFKSKKSDQDESVLQELQMILHIRHMTSRLFNNKNAKNNIAEQYYCRVMLTYYVQKLPIQYVQVKKQADSLICSFNETRHTSFCKTCHRIIISFTDFRMFTCEYGHKELRCPVTLGPLGMPCLVCSMCFTMANVNASKNLSYFRVCLLIE